MIYFDNAATSFPKPPHVIKAVYDTLSVFGGNPGRSGHSMSIKASKIVYNMRETVADFFGFDDPERVILTKNCTESLNLAILSIMKNGGNAVISGYEHNSVIRPLEYLKNQGICDYKIAKVNFNNEDLLIDEFEKLIDSDTKMVICTHASNVNGQISPIDKISKLCKRKNVIFCVDAAQTAGILNINMNRDNIDILCCPGHKSLFGPTGTGLLIFNKNVNISPIVFGGTGSASKMFTQPEFYPDMLESGTVNVSGAAGIAAGIKFIKKVGINKIHDYEMVLAKKFDDILSKNDKIIKYSFFNDKKYVPTICFNVKGNNCTEVSQWLNSQNIATRSGLHCSPLAHNMLNTIDIGTVRASFSYFNDLNEVKYAGELLTKNY